MISFLKGKMCQLAGLSRALAVHNFRSGSVYSVLNIVEHPHQKLYGLVVILLGPLVLRKEKLQTIFLIAKLSYSQVL
jgi:hypothetical protein